MSNLAYITGDGYLTNIGEEEEPHRFYKTPSFRLEGTIPLNPEERVVAHEILTQFNGLIVGHVRSFAAQLGVTAFEDRTAEYALKGSDLEFVTRITHVNGQAGEQVITEMRNMLRENIKIPFMHAGLLPDSARVSGWQQLARVMQAGDVSFEGVPNADGSINVPAGLSACVFHEQVMTRHSIESMFMGGEGRRTLASMRQVVPLPEQMDPRQFLVTNFNLNVAKHHAVLRPQVTRDGERIPVFHIGSTALHAGRTNGVGVAKGVLRQFELKNVSDSAQSLGNAHVTVDLYEAGDLREANH